MAAEARSGCPINLAMEVLGDRWSLIVLRDLMFGGWRRFRELQAHNMEGIASNILADRLKRLTVAGLLARHEDAAHRQKVEYRLTETSIQLVPIVALLGGWGRRHLPASEALSVRAKLLEEGGPELWTRLMDELRALHLGSGGGGGDPPVSPVLRRLTEAYEAAARHA